MALLFSHVRVSTPDGNEAEFLVSGIPREFEDFDYYTKFEDFIDSIEEDTEITVHAEAYTCPTKEINGELCFVFKKAWHPVAKYISEHAEELVQESGKVFSRPFRK